MVLSLLCHVTSIQLKCFLSHLNLTYLLVSRLYYHDHLLGIFSGGGSRGGTREARHQPPS